MPRARPARLYARLIASLRWLVLLAVAGGTWAALTMLPGLGSTGGGGLSPVGGDESAIAAQVQAVQQFGLPLLARTAVVQRDPQGLDPYTAARTVLLALEVDKQTLTTGVPPGPGPVGALPLINTPLLVPGAAEQNTTAITFLFADPSGGIGAQTRVAEDYADRIYGPDNALVGVTGTIPLLQQQGEVISRWLPLVEATTVAAIVLIVGLTFRSVLAPVVTLAAAAGGYLLADRVVGATAAALGFSAPDQLRPIVVALMLGVTTDYSIFFLSGLQRRLRSGETNPAATVNATTEYLPIVLTAGLTVACGLGSVAVADFALFRAFGPGLAVTVVVGLAVAVTVVPALLAILGRWAFWPSRFPGPPRAAPSDRPAGPSDRPGPPSEDSTEDPTEDATEDPIDSSAGGSGDRVGQRSSTRRTRLIRWLVNRRVAAVVVVLLTALLLAACWPLIGLRSAVAPVDELPAGNPVRAAAVAAGTGFTPGIVAPTEVIVSAPGITSRADALARLGAELHAQPGVRIVLGPADQPVPLEQNIGLFLAAGGGAARYLLAFDSDPLAATAIGDLGSLQDAMPRLLDAAGLPEARVAYAGDTALARSLADQARAAGDEVAVAVAVVVLLLLMLFLRALVAPLYLLATSVLAVGAALGLTTALFEGAMGADGLIFYVPFTAAVLLVSLGSDYNIFSVGAVWQQARRRSLPEALVVALPGTTRAINAAGLALSASFALVALIPLSAFRELAFAVAAGVLMDTLLVRSVLVPALIALVGRASGWPGRRLAGPRPERCDHGHRSPAEP